MKEIDIQPMVTIFRAAAYESQDMLYGTEVREEDRKIAKKFFGKHYNQKLMELITKNIDLQVLLIADWCFKLSDYYKETDKDFADMFTMIAGCFAHDFENSPTSKELTEKYNKFMEGKM